MYTPGMMGAGGNVQGALQQMRQKLNGQQMQMNGGGAAGSVMADAAQHMPPFDPNMIHGGGVGGGGIVNLPGAGGDIQSFHPEQPQPQTFNAPPKPAWQQLRDQGIQGQGSAAANKAALPRQPQSFSPQPYGQPLPTKPNTAGGGLNPGSLGGTMQPNPGGGANGKGGGTMAGAATRGVMNTKPMTGPAHLPSMPTFDANPAMAPVSPQLATLQRQAGGLGGPLSKLVKQAAKR